MSTLISVIIIIVSILLILVVLVQNSKGGGLASTFSSSNQVMGVRKTADFLEKATWTLAISLLVLSILSTSYSKPTEGATKTTESATRKMSEQNSGGITAPTEEAAPLPLNSEQPTEAPTTEQK